MKTFSRKLNFILGISLLVFGVGVVIPLQAQEGPPLKVENAPQYPPLIYRQGDSVVGVEADLAKRLGQELKRPVTLITLKWEDQIPGPPCGKDGYYHVGYECQPRPGGSYRFAEPYMKSGLVAAFRAKDSKQYSSRELILNSFATVAAVRGTTGDAFLNRNFGPGLQKLVIPKAADAVDDLKRGSIDIFLHDAPYILWMVSENEADISASSGVL